MKRLATVLAGVAMALAASQAAAATTTVDATAGSGYYPSMRLDPAGRPVILHHGASGLELATCTSGCTGATPTWVKATVDANGGLATLQLANGKPVVSYASAGAIKLATCTAGCDTPAPTWVYSTVEAAGAGAYNFLQLDGSTPYVAYQVNNDTMRMAVCTADCASASPTWAKSTVATAFPFAQYPTVQVRSGKPVVAFFDFWKLLLATCTADCATATPTWVLAEVDGAGPTGNPNSLQLRDDGTPVIAYRDYGNKDLKLATCTANCSSAAPTWAIATIDSGGDVGGGPSLALAAGGVPVVSYYDVTNAKVKVAACTGACTSSSSTWALTVVEDGGDNSARTSLALQGYVALVAYWGSNHLRFAVVPTGGPVLQVAPAFVAWDSQSQGTTSPPRTVAVTNAGGLPLAISSISSTDPQFAISHDCPPALAPLEQCSIRVTFTPTIEFAALNATRQISGFLRIVTNAADSPRQMGLTGGMEKSFVTHYYQSILGRAPDGAGRVFWMVEAQRMWEAGANVNETWFAMAQGFFNSSEYLAFNRDNAGFVTDLYRTFFNREPDAGGLAYWVDQRVNGLPREIVLTAFMFSPEFRAFNEAVFPNPFPRAERDAVMDFYRGLLSRLPDNDGFAFWVNRFRTAQCSGQAAVVSEVEAISKAFLDSGEYAARGRTNVQFVGDLYNAFLRRGGDLSGVQFWVDQLATSARTRGQVRVEFKNSAEFQARVSAIIARGCPPS